MSSLAKNMGNNAAVLVSTSSSLQVQTRPIPVPGPGQLLVRSRAAAINPSDWKMQDSKKSHQLPCILGSDVAGVIEAVGDDPKSSRSSRFQVGDRIAAFASGAWSGILEGGALQEYTLVSASSATHIPANISFEEASTIPMAIATAASALWHTLKIPRPAIIKEHRNVNLADAIGPGILIYGASSSVGLMAIQMASRMGYQVFAIASSKHEEYVRNLGAHYFVDRQGDDVVERLKTAITSAKLTEPLRVGVDAISSEESSKTAS